MDDLLVARLVPVRRARIPPGRSRRRSRGRRASSAALTWSRCCRPMVNRQCWSLRGIAPLPMKVLTTPMPTLRASRRSCSDGRLADRAVAREDDRVLRRGDRFDGGAHRLVVGAPGGASYGAGSAPRRPPAAAMSSGSSITQTPGFSCLGDLERLAHHLRDRVGALDAARPFGDRLVHGDRVHVLVAFLVQAPGAGLADDGDHRRAVHVGVGQAGDQVGRAGSQGGQADAGLAGQCGRSRRP